MLNTTKSLPCLVVALFLTVLLTGCGTSVWEREFQPLATPAAAAISTEALPTEALPADALITVREAGWGRLMEFRINLAERIRESDMHGVDWLAANRDVYKAALMRALQISEPADRVTLLGSSDFRSVYRLDGNDSRLEEFGRSVGANRVFWASSPARTRTGQESINDQTFATGNGAFDRRLDNRRAGITDVPAAFVPMAAQRNETAWLVYYLRIR